MEEETVEVYGEQVTLEELAKGKKTNVQSVICSKSKFDSVDAARKWVTGHKFSAAKVDETKESYRFRQFPPADCTPDTFRTISLTEGVSAVICKKKGGQTSVLHDEYLNHVKSVDDWQDNILVGFDEEGKLVLRTFAAMKVEGADDKEGELVHFISTPRVDPVRDVMNPFGIEGSHLDKNRAVFYNHRWNERPDLPIGKMLWRKSQREGVLCKTKFAVNETGFAGDIYRLYKGGYLNSFSIGWRMKEYAIVTVADLPKLINAEFDVPNLNDFPPETQVMYHKAWMCHEYSAVGVPMNEDARVAIRKALDTDGIVTSMLGRECFGSACGREKILAELRTTNPPLFLSDVNHFRSEVKGVVTECAGGLGERIASIEAKLDKLVERLDGEAALNAEAEAFADALAAAEMVAQRTAAQEQESEKHAARKPGSESAEMVASTMLDVEEIARGAVSRFRGKVS